jgi:hypothetical protein
MNKYEQSATDGIYKNTYDGVIMFFSGAWEKMIHEKKPEAIINFIALAL